MADWKAEDLVSLIHKRYGDSHVVLNEVPNGTGFTYQQHWIDVAVFSLWPSKGLTRSAFEIKVSRSDFIKELQNPAKHKWVRESFHEFWFVAPKDVILVDELPTGVGWMYPRGDKLVIKKHAARNDKPKLDDVLLAAFMRAAHKGITGAGKAATLDVLANSLEYQRALRYQKAVDTLFERFKILASPEWNEADIIKHLEEATMDKEMQRDRDQFLSMIGHFQREMASLFELFAIVAHHSLVARDETGRYIVSTFGGRDTESLKSLIKSSKSHQFTDYEKRYSQVVELILNWHKLQPVRRKSVKKG